MKVSAEELRSITENLPRRRIDIFDCAQYSGIAAELLIRKHPAIPEIGADDTVESVIERYAQWFVDKPDRLHWKPLREACLVESDPAKKELMADVYNRVRKIEEKAALLFFKNTLPILYARYYPDGR